MKTKILDLFCTSSATASIIAWLEEATTILTFFASIIAIVTGCISIYFKMKNACIDGKITTEEKKEIIDEAKEVAEVAKNIKENLGEK